MRKHLGILVLGAIVGCAVDNRFDSVPEGEGFPGYATDSGVGGNGPSTGGSGTGSDTSTGAQSSGGGNGDGGAQNTGGGSNSGGANTGGGANSGGAQNSGGTSSGGGGSVAQTIFSGSGVSVDPGSNTVGINGFFFVLEDSVDNGVPKDDPYLTYSDLDPDTGSTAEPSSFGTSTSPCVTGTIARVTAWDGAGCYDDVGSPYPCLWDDIWGGGIGLTLNEPDGGTKMAWDADAAGVSGFSFTTTGTSSAQLRVYLIDTAGEQFCTVLSATAGTVDVDLTDFQHNCWDPDTVQLDPTELEQIAWQFASSNGYAYSVDSFCIANLEVY